MAPTRTAAWARAALAATVLMLSACGLTPTGSLVVLAPVGASVSIDGHPRGIVGPDGLELSRVPTGPRHLEATLEGHAPVRATIVVERGQRVTLGLGPPDPASAPAGTPPPAVGEAIALDQARSFYLAGDAAAALVVLQDRPGAEIAALRLRVAEVERLWAESERYLAAGDGEARRAQLERILVVEPDPHNAYHSRARAVVR